MRKFERIFIICFGIIAITLLEYKTLSMHIDGVIFNCAVGAITLLIGYLFGYKNKQIKK
jgi:uncharacterized YccA/Bax inhibitor family protein